jgi:hypothetical protein
VNDFLVVYPDSIDERLLEYLDEDDEVHGPPVSLARRPGVVHLLYQHRLGSFGS